MPDCRGLCGDNFLAWLLDNGEWDIILPELPLGEDLQQNGLGRAGLAGIIVDASEAWSVTVKVLVVDPTGKFEPDARPVVCAVVAPGHWSVPTGVA